MRFTPLIFPRSTTKIAGHALRADESGPRRKKASGTCECTRAFPPKQQKLFLCRRFRRAVRLRDPHLSSRITKAGAAPTGFVGAVFDFFIRTTKILLGTLHFLLSSQAHRPTFHRPQNPHRNFCPTGNFPASRAITLVTAKKCKKPLPHSF